MYMDINFYAYAGIFTKLDRIQHFGVNLTNLIKTKCLVPPSLQMVISTN